MLKTCLDQSCKQPFEITDADIAYYKKRELPFPKLCPKERLKRLLSFRNERNLFSRKSDKSGRGMISNIRPEKKVPVYHVEEWHKDDWDAPFLPAYDFQKTFFEQYAALSQMAPRMHKASGGNEINSEYINHAGNCKNCYFIFNTEYVEDCMYLKLGDHCRDCNDSTNIFNSELCYECVNVERCYNTIYSDDCKNCRDSAFLRNCRLCANCLFCYGLEGASYNIFNKPVSKEEFEKTKKELKLDTYEGFQKAIETWRQWSKQFPLRRKIIQNCENCTGDSLYNSKNALDCYNCSKLEDCRYVINTMETKDSYDVWAYGMSQLCTNCITVFHAYDLKCCVYAIYSDHLEYCDTCWSCHYCFGCTGLKGKSYCIFNKQYEKNEYFDLVKRIKQKMLDDNEYGEFFPANLSVFPYEDSMAQEYFPLPVKENQKPDQAYLETNTLPNTISNADAEEICKNAYLCPVTGKLFRYQKQEIEFYKKMFVPIPHISFEARYKRRNQLVPFPY